MNRIHSLAALAAAALAATPAVAQRGPSAPQSADTACAACQDFFRFANQAWLDTAQIPAAYPSWGSFYTLYENNQSVLRSVLDDAVRGAAAAPAGSTTRKLGNYYGACMDSAAVEAQGARPLAERMTRIRGAATPAAILTETARLRRDGVGVLFSVGAGQDDKNSTQVVAQLGQGGLGLPDRDYYTKTDSASRALLDEYVAHVARTFRLLGDPAAEAQASARRVLAIETALANASMTRVQQRDPNAVYHKMDMAGLRALAPSLDWAGYFRELGTPAPDSLIVRQPEYVRAVGRMLSSVPAADWRAYLRWRLADVQSPRLSSAFVNENFTFGSRFSGAKEQLPRWKRCLAATDEGLGELLGQAYVQRAFTPQAKARMQEMVRNLGAALNSRFAGLDWMSDSTRAQAQAKLQAFVDKIGYPDRWRDYTALEVQPGSYAANAMRADRFEFDRGMGRIGKPVDRGEWGMTPPTVNAYYNPSMNEIVFPAGILQPPFFDPNADDATNYGSIGAVIGHEMTHGFDDQGRQYDAAGNLRDWWTAQDAERYKARAQRVIDQFAGYVAVDTVRLNGQLTAGENIADLGGLTIAYAAMQKAMEGKPREVINGYTPEQRFFLAWAQVWREQSRPEYVRMLVTVDPHSPGKWRVNGPLSNMPEFAAAFQCKAGDPMVRPENVRAQIW